MMRSITSAGTFGFPFVVGAAVFGLIWTLDATGHASAQTTLGFYQDKLRGSLFAGFLTLGSFLLSLKTGIVIKIKESVYDNEVYRKRVAQAQQGGSAVTLYGPLQRLSRMLAAAVASALAASILQLSIGLIPSVWAAAVCLSAAAVAVTFLLFAFTLIQLNMHKWFTFLEEKAAVEAAAEKTKDATVTGAYPSQFQ